MSEDKKMPEAGDTLLKEKVHKPVTGPGRSDYGKVLILSQSGNGKTFIGKTVNMDRTGLINVSRKSLPFKGVFKWHGKPKTWGAFIKNLTDYIANPEIDNIIIDDVTMAFDNLLMECQMNLKGYDIYTAYNRRIPEFLDMVRDAQKDMIVTGHDEILLIEGYKQKRAKIHGKQFEGSVEKYFTTVLYADKRLKEGRPSYFLRTFEEETSAKCPEGMFPDKDGQNKMEIPNDGAYIFKSIQEYYSI